MPELSETDVDQLRRLEEGMWLASTRSDGQWMDRHLAPDFHEFGRSGQSWTREEIIAAPIGDIDSVVPLPDFSVRQIADDVALVTYCSVVDGQSSLRSSIWSRSADGWVLEFHQGTPTTSADG